MNELHAWLGDALIGRLQFVDARIDLPCDEAVWGGDARTCRQLPPIQGGARPLRPSSRANRRGKAPFGILSLSLHRLSARNRAPRGF